MHKTRQGVKTSNFRLNFKVIIRRNKTKYFTYSIYIARERKHSANGSVRLSKTVELYFHDGNTLNIQSNKH